MGLVKKAKAEIVKTDAERSWKQGHKVFVCRFETAFSQQFTSGAMQDLAEMIEAVEDVGWVMDRFQFSGGARA